MSERTRLPLADEPDFDDTLQATIDEKNTAWPAAAPDVRLPRPRRPA